MITKKAEYAIRAVWQLAQKPGEMMTANQVASLQAIPPKYLPQIVSELVQAGLVTSSRGYNGGLKLNRQPDSIRLLDIIHATQGTLRLFECNESVHECAFLPGCDLKRVYIRAQTALEAVFAETRLLDMNFGLSARGKNG